MPLGAHDTRLPGKESGKYRTNDPVPSRLLGIFAAAGQTSGDGGVCRIRVSSGEPSRASQGPAKKEVLARARTVFLGRTDPSVLGASSAMSSRLAEAMISASMARRAAAPAASASSRASDAA